MSMIDKGLIFCTAQAFAADAYSTDSIPITSARKIFQGEPLCCFVKVDVAADAGNGDETYEFEVHTDDNAAMSSSTELIARAISRTVLTINTIHSVPVPIEAVLETFLAMRVDVGGTTPSVTATMWLGPQSAADQWTAYPDAITIA